MSSYDLVRRQLLPLRRRLRLHDTVLFASRTFWLAAVAFALIAVLGRLTPIASLLMWSLLPLLLWVLVMIGYLLFRPLPLPRVARRVDHTLDLRSRLATALELHDTRIEGEMSDLQQNDAASAARQVKAGQLPLRFDRNVMLAGMVPLALGLSLLFVPNPQDAVLAEQEQVEQAVEDVIEDLETLREEIANEETLSPEERAELEQRIAELQEELRQDMQNREEALAELSQAEAELQQQLDPQTDAREAALEQMARNLEQMSGQQPSQNPDLEEAARNLEELSEALENMSEEERQQLAEELSRQAAQMAAGDPQTAQDLSDAAQ
ncbi:DUF4175 domain-containing protein, partial [Candidatus Gracilibacteria bacterium]|nr:DUF4175 domain-containing protein [Candidatus Gracilibacteria bacterium]